MGLVLPKPILSKVVDRAGNSYTNASCASVNGFRNSMEDAHMLVAGDEVSYYGIFDGHSNEKCSQFVAERMPAKLKTLKEPITADALERACAELDEMYLEQNIDGGSTGTFCLVYKSGRVVIANVGDSRILVTRNGEVVFETRDHKPSDTDERERIMRCGGTVVGNRVDGDLAVSRAFGDGVFKVRGTKAYREQKVIAVPDVTEVMCHPGDIIVLACDGVYEGNFSSHEVGAYVHEHMSKCWGDIAVVASRVCDEAVRRGSKDNISCMIVQLAEGASKVVEFGERSFVPGPPFPRNHDTCRVAYTKMAELGHMTTAEALQLRYSLLKAYNKKKLSDLPPVMRTAYEMSDEVDVETERTFFNRGPSPGREKAFFEALASGSGN